MKKTFFSLMAALLLLSSCEVHHFMTDASYRATVEADLNKRLRPERLQGFFAVDKDKKCLTESNGFVSDLYLTTEEFEALEFLYAYMPLADVTDYSTDYYLQNIRSSFTARNEMGWNVPERIFRHFVLPVRANNENLDTSRVAFYRELKPRVEGMNMKDAILEVNHWCHEKLTYKPSDARTLSPLSSMRSSLGRCGEESTFAVAALRAVGIPARQVYTPRWAHTDDNHAWVEAWADGDWYFLGACEPEPVLNLGWFNSPASRGLLMHTRVFGNYDGPEEKVMVGPNFTEINLIDNYAKTDRVDFTVVDENGSPVDSALVDFKIYNYAEFYPALSKYTDAQGRTFLTAGMGDMMAWASKNGKYGYSKVSFGKDTEVKITISDQHSFDPQSMMIVPPPETANIPEVTPEQRAENDRRFAQEDSIRKAYMATFISTDSSEKGRLLAYSAGNHEVIEKFLEDHPDARALELLKSLSNKDMIDVTRTILDDSYNASDAILCPRVENEFLSPYKSFFAGLFGTGLSKEELSVPSNLIRWVQDSITVLRDPKAWSIPMSPIGVYQARMADVRSRNIFFVALARTLGIDARKDPVTGKIQYVLRFIFIRNGQRVRSFAFLQLAFYLAHLVGGAAVLSERGEHVLHLFVGELRIHGDNQIPNHYIQVFIFQILRLNRHLQVIILGGESDGEIRYLAAGGTVLLRQVVGLNRVLRIHIVLVQIGLQHIVIQIGHRLLLGTGILFFFGASAGGHGQGQCCQEQHDQ